MDPLAQPERVIRLEASIHPEHVASQRVAARIGLLPTDTLVDGEIRWVTPR
jgi:RimJ/RimL family protein N-acetyltransferase